MSSLRWAVKIYYDGSDFRGYARQPTGCTVEDHLIAALQRLSIIKAPSESHFISASRTDKGASALGNVVAFTGEASSLRLGQLNHELKWRIIAWAYARVPADFNPRKAALYRRYLYADYYHGEDLSLMYKAANMVNKAGVVRFKSGGAGLVLSAAVASSGQAVLLDVRVKWAMRGFIRRLWAAIKSVGAGKVTIEEFSRIISGELEFSSFSPPDGLLLLDVALPIKLTVDRYSLLQLLKRLHGKIRLHNTLHVLARIQRDSLARAMASLT
ncbi:MAG: hypothetical protein DRN96_04460 [Thermoproteota archaeon]|nr:MAG: hypothetical protein DRN96_04460 [Candidatus Korarchaeota archaeon]RLG56027.1 MAG: hypothetical protein DRN99_00820 [Candidatus Korarchaeota archaeon]